MKRQTQKTGWFLAGVLIAIPLASLATGRSLATGQGQDSQPAEQQSNISGHLIPEAALDSEEGRQLVEQLRQLRRTEAKLGPKHPSIASIRKQIGELEEKLFEYLPKSEGDKPLGEALPQMNAGALQHLLLQMAAKIERLERRVDKLEKQMGVF